MKRRVEMFVVDPEKAETDRATLGNFQSEMEEDSNGEI